MRNTSDKKQIIYNAVLKQANRKGIANISTCELSHECDLSEGTIFYYFKDVRNLLDQVAIIYDREIMDKCVNYVKEGKNLSELWDILFDYIIKNSDGANYYFSYVNAYGFNPTESNERASEFLEIAHILLKEKDHLNDHQLLLVWDYFTTQLFYYCNKITKGYMEDNKENKEFVKKLVFATYNNI